MKILEHYLSYQFYVAHVYVFVLLQISINKRFPQIKVLLK